MKITAKMLEVHQACEGDIEKFRKQWPKGCKITRENCEIAFNRKKLGLSVFWVVSELLSDEEFVEYQKVRNPARTKYDIEDLTWAEFEKICIEAFYQVAK